MNMSDQERDARYRTMFGCTKAEHDSGVEDALQWQPASMLVGSILSDCQEKLNIVVNDDRNTAELFTSYLEQVRQDLNRAKAILFDKISPRDAHQGSCDNSAVLRTD